MADPVAWRGINYRVTCGNVYGSGHRTTVVSIVTWFCYQLIAKPGNKTTAVPWPDPYDNMVGSCYNIQPSKKELRLCLRNMTVQSTHGGMPHHKLASRTEIRLLTHKRHHLVPNLFLRDHFVYAPSQWEMMLHCNIVSHWLGTYTKWFLISQD